MEGAVVRATLFGLLLAFVTSLPAKDDWDIYSFHVNSTVTSRYATTVITSRVVNRKNQSKEIEFQVRIPKNAFISKFRMLMDGQMYDGVVRVKEEALQQYTRAVSRGESAGIVSSVGRTLEEFKTSVTVAAHQKVTFELTYEELLKRRLGKYELQIHTRPMQPVRDFKIDVYIHEKAGINFMEVKGGLSTKDLANAITKTVTDKRAWVYFYPTEDQQKMCDSCGEQGMNGDLVIVYDVNRDNLLGDIKESDGYFVHHFAPVSLPRIPKNVVFLIDQSGSMHGRKIHQTRIALVHILEDLAEDDNFGLITFDSSIFPWKRELLRANKDNLHAAKNFARSIRDRGSTDINRAVLEGARMLNDHPREGAASILILLTDGDPTTGETNLEIIQSNVRRAINKKFPLYCLGFGFDVNFKFLEKMALENGGAARRIYDDSDADLQLKGFYEEVATPLLIDVTMIYSGGSNLTQTNFSQYYNGSEIVVAGQITDNNIETFTPHVVAISKNKRVIFSGENATVESSGSISDSYVQRVWAYLTVKQLLEKELQLAGDEKEKVKKEALELSLKYSFVTPLTSMVVTKPPGENTEVLHKPKEDGKHIHPVLRGPTWIPGHLAPLAPGYPHGSPRGHAPGNPTVQHFFQSGQIQLSYGGSSSRVNRLRKLGRVGGSAGGASAGIGASFDDTFVSSSARMSPNIPAPPVLGPGMGVSLDDAVSSARMSPYIPAPAVMGIDYHDSMDYDVGFGSALLLPDIPAPPNIDIDLHYSVDYGVGLDSALPLPDIPAPTTTAPRRHRFLLKAVNHSLPLCFDVVGSPQLKLLEDPSRELSVNGELESQADGFRKITIRHKTDQHIEIDATGITVREGHNETTYTAQGLITAGRVTMIWRDNEIDISDGDTRMVILLHEKGGKKCMWPVLRQRPSGDNIEGLLALKPADYEVVQQAPDPRLKIKDQEIIVTSVTAVDHSISSAPTQDCWLVAAESALQRPLQDFTVTKS